MAKTRLLKPHDEQSEALSPVALLPRIRASTQQQHSRRKASPQSVRAPGEAGATTPPIATIAESKAPPTHNPGKRKRLEKESLADGSLCATNCDTTEFPLERLTRTQTGTLDSPYLYLGEQVPQKQAPEFCPDRLPFGEPPPHVKPSIAPVTQQPAAQDHKLSKLVSHPPAS